jgi:hypothetical protein
MRVWLIAVGLVIPFAFLETTSSAAEDPMLVPVGVAKVDITPETPVRMYGYASRKTESEGVAGRLKAAALAIGGDEHPAVLLTVDCGAVPADIRDEVLRRVREQVPVETEHFVLANSHNHSGPNLKGMGSMEGQEREHLEQYATMLTDRLHEVVMQALENRTPAYLAWSQGNVDFAANRRVLTDGKWSGFGAVPDAPADHSLPLLRVTDANGKLRAVVANYACHCTTLRGNFKQIHGDWAACAQEYIEANHPEAVALITIGCGADADPCPHGTVDLCEQHGRAVANEVERLLKGEFHPVSPKLVARTVTIKIPLGTIPPLEDLKTRAGKSWLIEDLIERLEKGEKPQSLRDYRITTWAWGDDLAMVFLADEVVADYVLRMKEEFAGSRLWVSAYAHEVSTYIVSKRLFSEGGYEVRNSLSTLVTFGEPEKLEPPIEDLIIGTVREMLPESFR